MSFKIKDINNNLYVGVNNDFAVIKHIYTRQQNSNFDRSEFQKGLELSYSDTAPNDYYNLITFR